MKRLVANAGATATPSRPRSELAHSFEARLSAGVARSPPAGVCTRSTPG